jgi:hypothetical protein
VSGGENRRLVGRGQRGGMQQPLAPAREMVFKGCLYLASQSGCDAEPMLCLFMPGGRVRKRLQCLQARQAR